MSKQKNSSVKSYLRPLGVYGYDDLEPFILAALVSQDPLLLIGKSGTGKTWLLNRISEALDLDHLHYNASLVAFDDLIGFPFPSADKKNIEFLQSPASIWEAQSVLVDEISRCKPEIQNKFFSIIQERNIQGMALNRLKYRWAAMNPFQYDGESDEEQYTGSQPLDPALADRFGFILEVPDWNQLETGEQESVLNFQSNGSLNEKVSLVTLLEKARNRFLTSLTKPPRQVVTYVRLASGFLTEAGIRISPRRAQMLVRNILACESVLHFTNPGSLRENPFKMYKRVLQTSLPYRAFREELPAHLVDSVQAEVVRLMKVGNEKDRWISEFMLKKELPARIEMLFDEKIGRDIKGLGVIQMMGREPFEIKALFAFATYPALAEFELVSQEALDEVLNVASGIMKIDTELEWYDSMGKSETEHPGWQECRNVLDNIPINQELRRLRAKQLFLFLLSNERDITNPGALEYDMNLCFKKIREITSSKIRSHE